MSAAAKSALVIGGGPAGLMAAEELARAGVSVTLAEAKPTLARKFLMAGKSGLNLTRDEPLDAFLSHYSHPQIAAITREFGPEATQSFARDLGVELFTGSTGRVFPTVMKASPMLRAWIARLESLGVTIRTRWRWQGFDGDALIFDTPEGRQSLRPDATVLALGGASWPRLGSDAAWVPWLSAKGVEIAPFAPANMGFEIDWSAHMTNQLGQPVKGAALITPTRRTRGEFVISERGLEGGGIYELSAELREGAPLSLDLAPDQSAEDLAARLAKIPPKQSLTNRLRKGAKLDPVKLALALEWGRPLPKDPAQLAATLKSLPVPLGSPRPIAGAISSAGGITWDSLTDDLELNALPGVYAAGEMLDWEAPTGGYLLTACLASGRHAGRAAARQLASS
ncbi:NAD(FAD)-utilizing dehydrogenase [Thioclava sp. DLFJ5-1]|uniref:TIGR03862 family flavoprotein n=1 Tax=Thioclava sp. DLFJ5-1 TaxID=1915314 RepID=UPI0009C678DB|nr:TIGR03862 family flavoprotein [Thioclava sp. DLFJ5-1]OOY18991.1 NAD(FAD)-utilizing dehydrogenase [Thioclava sp. DLFJ5-1]